MKLDCIQQKKVEENMPLVTKVMKDKLHGKGSLGPFSYDDIQQIGYIGLCKAVYSDSGIGCFSTYAYRLIWHEICNALVKSNYIQKREILIEATIQERHSFSGYTEEFPDLKEAIHIAKQKATQTIRKGIQALELSLEGYSSQEIGSILNAQPGTVRMWKTRARRFLQSQKEVCAAAGA